MVSQAYEGVEQKVSTRTRSGEGFVEFRYFDANASEEARADYTPEGFVVEQLERVIDGQGVAQRDVAVLVRRNEEAARVLSAVLENNKRRAGRAPIRIVTSDALSLDASEDVQMVLAVLRMAVQAADKLAGEGENSVEWVLLSHYRMPADAPSGAWTFGLGGQAGAAERAWIGSLVVRPLLDAFDAVCSRYGVSLTDPYVSDLYGRMYRYQREESVDIRGFLEHYDALQPSERTIELPDSLDAVKLLTLHKSKGLEFKVVLLPMCGWQFRVTTPQQWGEVHREGWPESLLPFLGLKSARESYFFLDALEESWLEAIDSVNLLYVAFTRAKEQLYINAPGGRNDSVWKNLLEPVLKRFEGVWSSERFDGVQWVMSYGECPQRSEAAAQGEDGVDVIHASDSRRLLPRMKQTVRSGRAFEAEVGRQRSRDLGEALHALFETRPTRERFFASVQPFVDVGVLGAARAEALWVEIEEDLRHSPLRECFAEDANALSERDILLTDRVVRPDRVVEMGERAVVIDFKFAGRDRRHEKYVEQVRGYISSLLAMGYAEVEGYLWYVDPKAHMAEGEARVVRC